ncbi:Uncharacterised protein g5972 [Pycnogonum litorale]
MSSDAIAYGSVQEECMESKNIQTSPEERDRNKYLGLFFGMLTGVMFASALILSKLGLDRVSEFHFLFYRSSLETIMVTTLISCTSNKRELLTGIKREYGYIIANAIFTFSLQSFVYLAISRVSVLNVTVLLKSNIFTAILAFFVLKESLKAIDLITLMLTIIGITLVCKPTLIFGGSEDITNTDRLWGTIFALAATLSLSLCFIANRKLQESHFLAIGLSQTLTVFIGSMLIVGVTEEFKFFSSIKTFFVSFGVALFSLTGHLSLVRGLQVEEAVKVGIGTTIEVPSSFILQVIILHFVPGTLDIIGTILVFFGIVMSHFKIRLQKEIENVFLRLKNVFRKSEPETDPIKSPSGMQ